MDAAGGGELLGPACNFPTTTTMKTKGQKCNLLNNEKKANVCHDEFSFGIFSSVLAI